MDQNIREQRVELVKSSSDKHVDLLRPSRYSSSKGSDADSKIDDPESFQRGFYDKPLPCFGCGIGWFSFLFGFLFPLMWVYASILYLGNHYRKDPRERAGLAASAIAALACSIALFVILVYRAFI